MINTYDTDENQILYPLTHPQKRIWYIEKIYSGTSIHNIGGTVRVKGNIDLELLQKAINIFIKNNEAIRLRIRDSNGQGFQYVSPFICNTFDFIDFTHRKQPYEDYDIWIQQEAGKPFQLENSRLFYFALFKLPNDECGYFVKIHHIVADGWSMKIMTDQIWDVYKQLKSREYIEPDIKYTYTHYIKKEQEYISSDRFMKNKSFWNEKFKILPKMSNNSSDNLNGKRKTYYLDIDSTNKIKSYMLKNNISLNTLFTALYLVFLYQDTNKNDLVIGIPVFNRSGKKQKKTFGMFTSSMPFRFMIDQKDSLQVIIEKVNIELIGYYHNQRYPYDVLLQDLKLNKKGYSSLYNTCVNYYNTKLQLEVDGNPIENKEFYNGNQLYDLQIIIREWTDNGCLTLDFDYKVSSYTKEKINKMYLSIIDLLDKLFTRPNEPIINHNISTNDNNNCIAREFNNTKAYYPREKTVDELFEEQAYKTPDKIAVIYENIELTYREINNRSNQLASYLIKKGLKKEDIVGLLVTHSIEAVIGILGILKAGGAYLPIDPDYPLNRMCYMIEDSRSNILLTNTDIIDSNNYEGNIIDLNQKDIYSDETTNISRKKHPNDLAYVIYTSGTTGTPKGVMIEHQALLNYVWWAKKMYIGKEDEVFPLYSSLAFDLTVTSIFVPIICGHKIIIYENDDTDEYVLYRILKDNKATIIKLTPSHLSLLKNMYSTNKSIRKYIVGGEAFPSSLAREIHDSYQGEVDIFNEYGPTETAVGCMIHKYDYREDIDGSVPIGKPINNVQVFIYDDDLNKTSYGEIGELYIAGESMARGYLYKPLLTKERFIIDSINDERLYRTGDLVRYISNEKIEYIGRKDRQVKIRGYRVELAEIEQLLTTHKAVQTAVVDYIEDDNGSFLYAYVVKKYRVSVHELKKNLRKKLPEYMIPVHIFELDKIPLTANGKVDKEHLPRLTRKSGEERTYSLNEKQEVLINTISELLNIKHINLNSNFYHIGGDSIKAIQVSSMLSEIGYSIKVKDILSNPIIDQMADYINLKQTSVDQKPCEGSIKQTPITEWFFRQQFPDDYFYNQSILLELKPNIEVEQLEIMFNKLIRHHDSLRINVEVNTNELYYNDTYLTKEQNIETYDLSSLPVKEQKLKMSSIIENIKENYNIDNGILIKACLFIMNKQERNLFITAHHLVMDGVSWRIILDDMNRMLKQIKNNQKLSLPDKTDSFKSWADRLEIYKKHMPKYELDYWNEEISHLHFPSGVNSTQLCHHIATDSVRLGSEETKSLLIDAKRAYNSSTEELLLTALIRTKKQLIDDMNIIIQLEGHGRDYNLEDIDITRTVGWFTNLYPVYINLKTEDICEQIKQIKEKIRNIPNKGIGYGLIEHKAENDNDKIIRFNYLGDFITESSNMETKIVTEYVRESYSKPKYITCLIEINCYIIKDQLDIIINFNKDIIDSETIKNFALYYRTNISDVLTHCCNKKEVEFTPTDFDTLELTQDEIDNIFK